MSSQKRSAKSGLPHFMYVLECADGTLYTGYTIDVEQRIEAHNAGCGAKYTRSRLPVKLLLAAEFATKHEAMSAEFRFKRLDRAEKLALIEKACKDTSFAAVLNDRFTLVSDSLPDSE